jgi:Tat protein translocase TatB subunit
MNMPGGPEILVCLMVALVVIGPHRLPEAARKFGAALAKFRSATTGVRDEIREVVEPVNKIRSEIRTTIRETTGLSTSSRPSVGDSVPTLRPRSSTMPAGPGEPPPLTDEEIVLPTPSNRTMEDGQQVAPPSQSPLDD